MEFSNSLKFFFSTSLFAYYNVILNFVIQLVACLFLIATSNFFKTILLQPAHFSRTLFSPAGLYMHVKFYFLYFCFINYILQSKMYLCFLCKTSDSVHRNSINLTFRGIYILHEEDLFLSNLNKNIIFCFVYFCFSINVMRSRGISRRSNMWHFQFSIWLMSSLGEVHFAENPTWIGPVVPKL